MAKSLKDILTGVKSSKTEPMDLKDLAMSPEGNKGELDFAKKHNVEKHDDRAGNDDHIYKGSTTKTTKYKFQKDGVYEETEELDEKYMGFQKTKKGLAAKGAKDPSALAAWIGRKKYGKTKFQAAAAAGKKLGEEVSCNHSAKGIHCEMHGDEDCSSASDKEPRYKGKKLITDKKAVAEGRVEDVAHKKVTKQLADIAKSSNVPVTKVKPGKKQYNELKSTGAMFGGARTMAAGLSKRDIEAGQRGGSVGKAIVKEEDVNEAGGFSYGAKKPRKGSLKDLISKKRKEYNDKQPVIEPKDQMVGTAKVVKENIINEVAPPNPKIEKWIKSNKERFVKEYGKEKGMQVLYAKAWKMHGQSESGSSTNTDYTGPGAAGWTTGRLDVGTL